MSKKTNEYASMSRSQMWAEIKKLRIQLNGQQELQSHAVSPIGDPCNCVECVEEHNRKMAERAEAASNVPVLPAIEDEPPTFLDLPRWQQKKLIKKGTAMVHEEIKKDATPGESKLVSAACYALIMGKTTADNSYWAARIMLNVGSLVNELNIDEYGLDAVRDDRVAAGLDTVVPL